jgi:pimeloyl-ACP methyl ester carboxylesterase
MFDPPLDFEAIKQRAEQFLFIHSDDDPYCPLQQAAYLAERVGGTLKVIPGQKHFSAETDPAYTKFPLLRDLLLTTDITSNDA